MSAILKELLDAYRKSVDCADPDCQCEGNDEAKALVLKVLTEVSSDVVAAKGDEGV